MSVRTGEGQRYFSANRHINAHIISSYGMVKCITCGGDTVDPNMEIGIHSNDDETISCLKKFGYIQRDVHPTDVGCATEAGVECEKCTAPKRNHV